MSLIGNAWYLSKEFFFDKETRKKAFILLLVSIIFELVIVYISVILNKWNNDFYNALQALNKPALYKALGIFCIIVLFYMIAFVSKYFFHSKLHIYWRQSMTNNYINKWVNDHAYFGNNLFKTKNDNPDQRISEDINSFIKLTINISLGLLSNIISLISFTAILWTLSGVLKFTLFSFDINISGYLVWLSIIYAGIGTIITYRIGKKLSSINYAQEQKEANFRFSMMRFRENAESVVLYNGIEYEKKVFSRALEAIVQNFNSLITINKNLGLWTSLYHNTTTILPIIAACPRFFAKEILLGGLFQISSAFREVHSSLSFLVNSFTTIAEYKAIVSRLVEFNNNIENWNKALSNNQIKVVTHDKNNIILENLYIHSPVGEVLAKDINLTLSIGESYLISGRNGAGKSTFVKALKAVWPFGKGKITIPNYTKLFVIPQKTYMPLGKLIEAIAYPKTSLNDNERNYLESLMIKLNISYLIDRLNNEENWSISLSLGEQQKIGILRAILSNPKILVMDESTSALTENDEKLAYTLLKEILVNAIIITIGHRESLKIYHTKEIKFSV